MPKRASEEGEGKDGKDEQDEAHGGLLAKAIKHCWGDEFLDVFRAYFRKHGPKFEVRELAIDSPSAHILWTVSGASVVVLSTFYTAYAGRVKMATHCINCDCHNRYMLNDHLK